MSLKRHPLRIVALTISGVIAAGLSLFYWGGLLIFAGRIETLLDVCMVYVPVMTFPIALLAWWKFRIGAGLWILMTLLFFGGDIVLSWPKVAAAIAYRLTSLSLFLVVGVLLVWVAAFDHRSSLKKQ
jgi:hypothetical protein